MPQMFTGIVPIFQRFFQCDSISNKMYVCFHPNSDIVITTKFCTWHHSYTVVACAKICCDLMSTNGITTKRMFPFNLNCEWKLVSGMDHIVSHIDYINGLCATLKSGTANIWECRVLCYLLITYNKYNEKYIKWPILSEGNRVILGSNPSIIWLENLLILQSETSQ